MRMVLFLGLIFCLGNLNAQSVRDEAAIRKTVSEFFAAFHARDSVRLKGIAGPGCILRSISVKKDGKVVVSTQSFDGFVRTVTTLPETVDFREKPLSFDIRHDRLMADVWVPYEFYYDHKLHHTGVNSFVLFRNEQGRWKILGITDTREKPSG